LLDDKEFCLACVDPPYGIGMAKTTNIANLKKGFIEEEMVVYYMDDMVTKEMHIYLENGNFYETRPFEPEEFQTKIKNIG